MARDYRVPGRQVIHIGGAYNERGRPHQGEYLSGLNALLVAAVNAHTDTGEVAALRAALGLVDQMRDKTLIGDTVSLDPAIAYQHGANAAFAQAADIARAALSREE